MAKQSNYMRLALSNTRVTVPRTGTPALRDFFVSFLQIEGFLRFVFGNVAAAEDVRRTASVVLFDTADAEEKERLEADWAASTSPITAFGMNRQFMCEVFLVRHVENYLAYLYGLLHVAFTSNPRLMRQEAQLTVGDILGVASVQSLIEAMAEKQIGSLSYKGFDEIAERFHEHKLAIASPDDVQVIREAIEIRNISVHNRCIVDERFVSRAGTSGDRIGQRRELFSEDVERIAEASARSVTVLDRIARRKWGIRGNRFDPLLLHQESRARTIAMSAQASEPHPTLAELSEEARKERGKQKRRRR